MNDEGGVERIDLEKVDWRGSREFFESLGEALDKLDDHDESYDFTWVGKRKSIIEAGAPINKTLRPDVESSKNWDTTENLFIEGDNLDALKLLQESYLGKVKMIYIDPPYNTGKDFVYHDNFKANIEQYDEDTEYRDEDGKIQFKKNDKSNGRYHSDWLSMMYPRLKLARNLLSEDGVIFISIGEDEQANLKKLCDEVFSESNYVGQIIPISNPRGSQEPYGISSVHEYVLCYTRTAEGVMSLNGLAREDESEFNYTTADGRKARLLGLRKRGGDWKRSDRPNMYFSFFVNPLDLSVSIEQDESHTIEVLPKRPTGEESRWTWGKDTSSARITELVAKEITRDGKKEYDVYRIDPLEGTDGTQKLSKVKSVWDEKELNYQNARTVAKNLFGNSELFDFPKPVEMISKMMRMLDTDNYITLDFFSGSATTAHAVMQLNAEDGGNRKWIMVQLPEETDEKSEAFKAGYKTIPEISRERIRRAGDKIASEHPDAKVDYGFRALRIDDTNMKDVYHPAADIQQSMLDDLVDNVREDRSDFDLLFGVLTQSALELNRPLETSQLDSTTVYKYDYFGEVSGLVACFAPEISEATIKSIAAMRPLTVVFREASFPDSQAKVNLAEHFRIISPDTKVKVV